MQAKSTKMGQICLREFMMVFQQNGPLLKMCVKKLKSIEMNNEKNNSQM